MYKGALYLYLTMPEQGCTLTLPYHACTRVHCTFTLTCLYKGALYLYLTMPVQGCIVPLPYHACTRVHFTQFIPEQH